MSADQTRDPRCGCPQDRIQPSRADRRYAARSGMPAPKAITLHRDGCWRAESSSGAIRRSVRKAKRK